MIIKKEILLIGKESKHHDIITKEVRSAISRARIVIPPIKKANGVKPIKKDVMSNLNSLGWKHEHPIPLENMRSKPLDAYKKFKNFRVGFEWETGNISSTFRSLMKLFKGLIENQLDYGILALPSHEFYKYLTDRVGNIKEIEPYFSVYRRIKISDKKTLKIIVVEYDSLDKNASPIPKGTDGRARR